jgi:hypothetical protein
VDRHWHLVTANSAVAPLLSGVSSELLASSPNVLRLSLHPDGHARRIRNLRDWRAHVFHRLARQIDATADPVLTDLLAELRSYPVPGNARPPTPAACLWGDHASTLELALPDGTLLSLLTTTTVFGTATDIAISELAISELAISTPVFTSRPLVARQFGLLNRHLEGRDYILDGGRSVIDAYSFPMIRWAKKLLPGGVNAYHNVQALHDRIAADPAVQKVLAREEGK